jgi:hypothetical protein
VTSSLLRVSELRHPFHCVEVFGLQPQRESQHSLAPDPCADSNADA